MAPDSASTASQLMRGLLRQGWATWGDSKVSSVQMGNPAAVPAAVPPLPPLAAGAVHSPASPARRPQAPWAGGIALLRQDQRGARGGRTSPQQPPRACRCAARRPRGRWSSQHNGRGDVHVASRLKHAGGGLRPGRPSRLSGQGAEVVQERCL